MAKAKKARKADKASRLPVKPIRPELLICVRFLKPSTLKLTFADKEFSLPIERLEMPVDRIRWSTAMASATGETMTVMGIKGDPIPIDSSTLRYLVDEEYAAEIDASLKSLQLSRGELQQLALDNPPPDAWYDQPEKDLRRRS